MFLFQLVPVMAGVQDILYAIIVKKQAEIRDKEKPRKRLNLRGLGRTGRDSNPRYAFDVHTISNRALSTTQTPAHAWHEPLVKGCGGNIHEKLTACKLILAKKVIFFVTGVSG